MSTNTHPIRTRIEADEAARLHPLAAHSAASAGRERPEGHCPFRTAFQRDRDRILHSRAFRRLKHKTQVFISPQGDHYRTRLTHSLEVAQIARTIARALGLNEDLTEAIALGHDLGHPPFGHTGEMVLHDCMQALNSSPPLGFYHEQHSVRIVTVLEPLNLSREVLDALAYQGHAHGVENRPVTLEAMLVSLADRMTYLHHDVEDAIAADMMQEADIPQDIRAVLGETRKARLDTMVMDCITTTQARMTSPEAGVAMVALSDPVMTAVMSLRKWMFERVYLSPTQGQQSAKVRRVLSELFAFYQDHPEQLSPPTYQRFKDSAAPEHPQVVVDYLAGMTDRFALAQFQHFLLPSPHPGFDPLVNG